MVNAVAKGGHEGPKEAPGHDEPTPERSPATSLSRFEED